MNIRLICTWTLMCVLFFFIQSGCESQNTLVLPTGGDIEAGKLAFRRMSCDQCHSTPDIPWKGLELEGDVHVRIGDLNKKPVSYGELVTSIIDPSYKIAKRHVLEMTTKDWASKMRRYNELMTVQDLVDIVTYLEEVYEITPHSDLK